MQFTSNWLNKNFATDLDSSILYMYNCWAGGFYKQLSGVFCKTLS